MGRHSPPLKLIYKGGRVQVTGDFSMTYQDLVFIGKRKMGIYGRILIIEVRETDLTFGKILEW